MPRANDSLVEVLSESILRVELARLNDRVVALQTRIREKRIAPWLVRARKKELLQELDQVGKRINGLGGNRVETV